MVAFKVLARWIRPTLGHLAAADFLPLAVHHGPMGKVNDVVIRTAIKDTQTWPSAYAIKAAGMCLSLNGYGVDDVPMEMLADLPVDEIKAYRVAIAAADSSGEERTKLRNTITTITGQKIEVTAIGLEAATDRVLASAFGFHSAKGYFIARPWRTRNSRNSLRKRAHC